MSLYNKYRPIDFNDIHGQNHIVTILRNIVKEKAGAHAYIFSGTRGVGKTTVARIFARGLNCTGKSKSKTGDPCNKCEILIDTK